MIANGEPSIMRSSHPGEDHDTGDDGDSEAAEATETMYATETQRAQRISVSPVANSSVRSCSRADARTLVRLAASASEMKTERRTPEKTRRRCIVGWNLVPACGRETRSERRRMRDGRGGRVTACRPWGNHGRIGMRAAAFGRPAEVVKLT